MNRQNAKHNYIKLQKYVEYKSAWNGYATIYVKARGTSKTCSRCGYYNKDLSGEVFKCPNCGLAINRQKNAALNVWNTFLSMWGVKGSPRKEPNPMKPPMNPEEAKGDEAQELRLFSSEPEKSLEAGDFNWSCFASQQSAEKSLKALALHVLGEFPRGHDLVMIYRKVKHVTELGLDEPSLATLSAYYTVSRYPNAGLERPSEAISRQHAVDALEIAVKVYDTVSEALRDP